MNSIGGKKTEAVNAYVIKNSKGEGEGENNNKKQKNGCGGGWGEALSQAVGWTGRSCMGV